MLKDLSYLQFEAVAITMAFLIVSLVIYGTYRILKWIMSSSRSTDLLAAMKPRIEFSTDKSSNQCKLPDDYTMNTHHSDGTKRIVPLNTRIHSNDIFDHMRANAEDLAREREAKRNSTIDSVEEMFDISVKHNEAQALRQTIQLDSGEKLPVVNPDFDRKLTHEGKFDHLWHRGFRSSGGQFMSRIAWLNLSYQEQLAMLKAKLSIRSDG